MIARQGWLGMLCVATLIAVAMQWEGAATKITVFQGMWVVDRMALFLDAGSCADILGDLQSLAPSFPGVRFAAVALRGDRAKLRRLVSARAPGLPVGVDRDGSLLGMYKVATCPQVTFAYPGGIVQSAALLKRPPIATLRARVRELVAASRARGWRGGGA